MTSPDRYSRQTLFRPLGEEGQRRLASSRATIVGCGALGSSLANLLARAGVGGLRIVDRDFVELDNLQRQVLFDEEDVRGNLPKAIAAANKLRRINSSIQIESVVADCNYANAESFAADAHILLDGTDNFETRFVLNDACVKLGKPWVYGGCVSSYGMVLPILPGETACLTCWIPQLPAPGSSPTCDTAGVLNSIVGVVASLQANEAIKILSGHREALQAGLVAIDVWSNSYRILHLKRREDCPTCVKKEFPYLQARESGTTTTLCGRNAVQITPPPGGRIDLAETERRLAGVAKVKRNDYLLKAIIEDYELTVFPDARAIIKGTDDPSKARSLYAKYVGS